MFDDWLEADAERSGYEAFWEAEHQDYSDNIDTGLNETFTTKRYYTNKTLKQKIKLKLWKIELFFTYRFKLIKDIFKSKARLEDEIPF